MVAKSILPTLESCDKLILKILCTHMLYINSLGIMELKILKGLSLQDIITEIHTYIHRS